MRAILAQSRTRPHQVYDRHPREMLSLWPGVPLVPHERAALLESVEKLVSFLIFTNGIALQDLFLFISLLQLLKKSISNHIEKNKRGPMWEMWLGRAHHSQPCYLRHQGRTQPPSSLVLVERDAGWLSQARDGLSAMPPCSPTPTPTPTLFIGTMVIRRTQALELEELSGNPISITYELNNFGQYFVSFLSLNFLSWKIEMISWSKGHREDLMRHRG